MGAEKLQKGRRLRRPSVGRFTDRRDQEIWELGDRQNDKGQTATVQNAEMETDSIW